MTAPDKDGWITYRPGDPIPSGKVRVRCADGWESAEAFGGWSWGRDGFDAIVAYLPESHEPPEPPESPPQETEADRLARCAPQLVEALKRIEHGKLIHADDGSTVLVDWSPGEASEIARQALSEAGIEL